MQTITSPCIHKDELFQTAVASGNRFALLREEIFTGKQYIDTSIIAHSPYELQTLNRRLESDLGSEWCEDNPTIGVVEVSFNIVRHLNIVDMEQGGAT